MSSYKSGSLKSFLDAEVNTERGRRGKGRSSESQTGSLDKGQSWPNLGASRGQRF